MATAFPRGSKPRFTCTFTNAAGTAVDPTTVAVTYLRPGDSSSTTKTYSSDAEVVKSATGVYYIDLDLDTEGEGFIRWAGTGLNKAAGEGRIRVKESRL